jgi:hypothetical protein
VVRCLIPAATLVFLLVGCTPHTSDSRSSVHLDVAGFKRQAQDAGVNVTAMGLMVVRSESRPVEEVKQEVETDEGAAASVTPIKTREEVSGTQATVVNGTGAGEVSNAPTGGGAVEVVREVAAEAPSKTSLNDVTAVANSTAAGAELDVPKFAYFPLDASAEANRAFELDVPAGRNQRLYLFGFTDGADGQRVPAYVGLLESVDLLPLTTYDLAFTVYPAGVVRPVVAVNTLGITDGSGAPISLPQTANCVGVATALSPREGFPKDVAVRVPIGALSKTDGGEALDATEQANALSGFFVLPAGEYSLTCLANLGGQLFGSSTEAPPVVRVSQGRVLTPSLSLQRLRTLPVSGGTPVPTGPTGNSNNTIQIPTFRIELQREVGLPLVRQTPISSGTVTLGTEAVVNTDNEKDVAVTLTAVDGKGNRLAGFSANVRVSLHSAFGKQAFPIDWLPFEDPAGTFAGIGGDKIDVALVDGFGTATLPLRLTTLPISPGGTRNLVVVAQAIDADGRGLAPTGAHYFTVRRVGEAPCPAASSGSRLAIFIPGAQGGTFSTVRRPDGSYTSSGTRDVLLMALSSDSAQRPQDCAYAPFEAVQVSAVLRNPLASPASAFLFDARYFTIANGAAVTSFPAGTSQVYLRDVLSVNPAVFTNAPAKGSSVTQFFDLYPFDDSLFSTAPEVELTLRVE